MKLGVGINIFDGLEFLEFKIINTRKFADYIVALVQNISYFGEEYNESWKLANQLKDKNLIDDVVLFTPKFNGPVIYSKLKSIDAHRNEVAKRNLGLEYSIQNDCTHYCSTDLDEFYFEDEINYCKNFIKENNIDTTACSIQEYYSKPIYKKKTIENKFYVPLISKIEFKFVINADYFVYVDPTRGVKNAKNCYLFSQNNILMHHYSTVRKNKESLVRKYRNNSAKDNFKTTYMNKISNIMDFDVEKNEDYEKCENHFEIVF